MDHAVLIHFFEELIPFNKHLGMKVVELTERRVVVRVPYTDTLIGDPFRPAIHGGVISALADTAGGLAVFLRIGFETARCATVDLRVDYYLPARQQEIIAEAEVVRIGNRVGVARILVKQTDETGTLVDVAEGKGVYNIFRVKPIS
jgi:uncharacterized protein (TIGR00369 family)